jgi:hypothetical protein
VNQLQGFAADSYGILQVSSNIDGRVMFYRANDTIFSNFDFVFALPLQDAQTGTSYVGFNTYQPSFNPGEQGYLVANWLSIVNLSSSARQFSILKYDISGALLAQSSVTVNALSRADFEGGHTVPGPSHVGLIQIVPQDGSTKYSAQLMRYGYGPNNTFEFAFPLVAQAGFSGRITVPLGSAFLAQNWLEVVNTSINENIVQVSLFDAQGNAVAGQSLSLAAKAQQHVNINAFLGDLKIGYARIESLNAQPLVAESMFYFRNATTGSITSMYGSQARSAVQQAAGGSYNLFLGMENYLKISNVTDQAVQVDVTVSSAFSTGSSRTLNVAGNSSVELPLHNTATYGTAADSYGRVTVSPVGTGKGLLHELLRLKHEADGQVQFTAPTLLEEE